MIVRNNEIVCRNLFDTKILSNTSITQNYKRKFIQKGDKVFFRSSFVCLAHKSDDDYFVEIIERTRQLSPEIGYEEKHRLTKVEFDPGQIIDPLLTVLTENGTLIMLSSTHLIHTKILLIAGQQNPLVVDLHTLLPAN